MNHRLLTTKVFAINFLIFALALVTTAQTSIFELPAGTRISVRMENEINSRVSSPGDTFTTVVAESVSVRETIVLAKGTIIEGRVVSASRASAGGRPGTVEIVLETIRFAGGERRAIEAIPVNALRGASSKKTAILSVIGATIGGAVIGGATKSGVGAVVGAGIGAGAGTGTAIALKGKDVAIRNDEIFSVKLLKPVTLPAFDY